MLYVMILLNCSLFDSKEFEATEGLISFHRDYNVAQLVSVCLLYTQSPGFGPQH